MVIFPLAPDQTIAQMWKVIGILLLHKPQACAHRKLKYLYVTNLTFISPCSAKRRGCWVHNSCIANEIQLNQLLVHISR